MVLRLDSSEGISTEPIVITHWRQDWRYEQRRMCTFHGNLTWRLTKQSRSESRGRWVQSVYQIDDSHPYMAATAQMSINNSLSIISSRDVVVD